MFFKTTKKWIRTQVLCFGQTALFQLGYCEGIKTYSLESVEPKQLERWKVFLENSKIIFVVT